MSEALRSSRFGSNARPNVSIETEPKHISLRCLGSVFSAISRFRLPSNYAINCNVAGHRVVRRSRTPCRRGWNPGLLVTATLDSGASPLALSETNNGDVVEVVVTVEFDSATPDRENVDAVLDLEAVDFTLTQVAN